MTVFLSLAVLVPVLDQWVKHVVRTRIGGAALSLGLLGRVQVVHTTVWAVRASRRTSLRTLWTVWAGAAATCMAIAALAPEFEWAFGLLTGGAFSHALETTRRGAICDYVCLRFWPPFNLADVALTLGLLGALLILAARVS